MSVTTWWMRALVSTLALAPCVQGARAGDLEGNMRETFVRSSNESCIKVASTPQNLKILSPAVIATFCSCVTEKVAERITGPEIVAAIRDGKSSATTDALVQEVSPACLKQSVR